MIPGWEARRLRGPEVGAAARGGLKDRYLARFEWVSGDPVFAPL